MTQLEEGAAQENPVDITPDGDGGVLKEILRRGCGEGRPCPGDSVYVHYVGTLTNGTKFDSSRDREQEFTFVLGKGSLIKAWNIGITTMKKGELARFTCKPEYAYGKTGSPPKIGPNETLIFEIELFRWTGEDLSEAKDGSIERHQIQKGEGYKSPNDGATVKIHYVGQYEGKVFEDREVEFIIGQGMDVEIIEGLEVALKNFKSNEKSLLTIAPKYAYGHTGSTKFNIPPNATLQYEVELKSFEKVKESWEMDTKEKLEQSEIVKAKGTKYFKEEKYGQAIKQYKKIVTYLEHESGLDEDDDKLRKTLMLAARLNLAMCYLKMQDYHKTVGECDKALEQDPQNIKALFRRGQARLSKNEYELAQDDFQQVVNLDGTNKAAKNHITICIQKLKQYREREKKTYAKMFTKFAMQDAKSEASGHAKEESSTCEEDDKESMEIS